MAHKVPESVLVVIHDTDGQVLLLQRADSPEFWQSVTGAKDTPSEHWRNTAVREVQEETGIDALAAGCTLTDLRQENRYALWPEWRYRYAPEVTHNTERVFALCVQPHEPVVLNPREHLQYLWCSAQDAAARCRSAPNAHAIEQLAAAQFRHLGTATPQSAG